MNFRERGWEPLDGLTTAEFVIRPLLEVDAELDYEAVVDSREQLRIWEQDDWPSDDFTVDDNRADLRKHEEEAEVGLGYTYTVMSPDGTECLGCVYIYSPTIGWLARLEAPPEEAAAWEAVDAVTVFWIRTSRLAEGMEASLVATLRSWIDEAWPFEHHMFQVTAGLAHQVATLEASGLLRRATLTDPKTGGITYAYA